MVWIVFLTYIKEKVAGKTDDVRLVNLHTFNTHFK